MSGSTTPAAPAPAAAPNPIGVAVTPAAPVATPDVGATVVGSAEPAPSPAPIEPAAPAAPAEPSALEQTLLDAPPAEAPVEPPAPLDPGNYEVKLPEGMTREDPMVSTFLVSAAELGMKGEAVQAVLDKMAPLVAEQLAAPAKAWKDLNTEWQAAIKADPEVGGSQLAPAVARINSVIDRFGSPELKDALRMTGAANNPHIFRFLNKLSSAYAEATPVAAGNSGHVAPPPGRAALDKMYPSARQANAAA